MDPRSALFDFSVALLVDKDRVEGRQLKESDIRQEIDYVKLQLNGLVRSYLLSSITYYSEGVLHLFKLKSSSNKDEMENAAYARSLTNPMTNVSQTLKDLRLSNLDEGEKRALKSAKKAFENARKKAIDAFNNETLPIFDRIQAMAIRVAATMLANIEHPEDALIVCLKCLEELHSVKEIQENFSLEIRRRKMRHSVYKDRRRQMISSVCRINYFVHSAAAIIAKEGELLTWPQIEIEGGKVDPLHDHRLAEALRKQKMPHYEITPSALGEEGESMKPKIPQAIVVNSQDHCIVAEEWDNSVNIFEISPDRLLRQISIGEESSVVDVAIGDQDDVYVLLELNAKTERARFKIFVFDEEGNKKKDFFLREKTEDVSKLALNNNKIFVLTKVFEIPGGAVDVYDCDGQFTGLRIGEETLNCPQDICSTNDGRVVVLDRDDQCVMSAQMFNTINGQHIDNDLLESVEKEEKTIKKLRSSIACHQVSNYVVIAFPSETDQEPVRILKYDMSDGTLLPSVHLPMNGQVSTRGVAITSQGRIAIGLLDKDGGDSKVLLV